MEKHDRLSKHETFDFAGMMTNGRQLPSDADNKISGSSEATTQNCQMISFWVFKWNINYIMNRMRRNHFIQIYYFFFWAEDEVSIFLISFMYFLLDFLIYLLIFCVRMLPPLRRNSLPKRLIPSLVALLRTPWMPEKCRSFTFFPWSFSLIICMYLWCYISSEKGLHINQLANRQKNKCW